MQKNPITFWRIENSRLWHFTFLVIIVSRVICATSIRSCNNMLSRKINARVQTGVSFFSVETFKRASGPSNEHLVVSTFVHWRRRSTTTHDSLLHYAQILSRLQRIASNKEQCTHRDSRESLSPFHLILSLLKLL